MTESGKKKKVLSFHRLREINSAICKSKEALRNVA